MSAQGYHPRIPEPAECRALVAGLTDAEWETLDLVASGYTIKEVARARRVALRTTRNQINSALHALGVQGVTQAFVVLLRADALEVAA